MKIKNNNQITTSSVSVAMATYNGAKYLKEQLESIACQTVLPSEIVISDDCSSDETRGVVERFIKSSGMNVKFLPNQFNIGIINNFFNAFDHCTGDYIFYCDQDDVWMPDKVEQCLHCFEQSKQIKLVIHQNNIVDQNLKDQGIIQPHINKSHILQFPVYHDSVWGFGHQMAFHRTILPMLAYLKDLKDTRLSQISKCFDLSIVVAAGLNGDVYMLKKPLVFFRRHSDSTTNAGKQIAGLFDKAKNKNEHNNHYIDEIEAMIEIHDSKSFQNLLPVEQALLYKDMLKRKLIKYKKITQLYTGESLSKYIVALASSTNYALKNNLIIKKEIAKNIFYSFLLRVSNK